MHIVKSKFTSAEGKTYETVLLRESYREGKSDRYRNRRKRFDLRFNLIAGICNQETEN